jgi:hypothetical protein
MASRKVTKKTTKPPYSRFVGENTGEIKKDISGNPFALILESTEDGLTKGDTIRPIKSALTDGDGPGSGTGGKFIMGGDYNFSKISKNNYQMSEIPFKNKNVSKITKSNNNNGMK